MQEIDAKGYRIVFNTSGYIALNKLLHEKNYSAIFVVVDTNTKEHCMPSFLSALETTARIEIIEISPGEINKNIQTATGVWEALAELDADRKSLILNLGGGVVTDLGGFIASTYMRGIDFIQVPTSLLSMVDASVGGKTGIDLGTLKNLVGVIKNPEMVCIDTGFLSSLPPVEMRSGLAEMYKHGLIYDKDYWLQLSDLKSLTVDDLNGLIHSSIEIKNKVVTQDPKEFGVRKTLNFGHTLGHAIESYCLESSQKTTLLHGEAIAIGMILESYLSTKVRTLPLASLDEITAVFIEMFPKVTFSEAEMEAIIKLMKHDKKNSHGNINFVLLDQIGAAVIDQQAEHSLIREAFAYYHEQSL